MRPVTTFATITATGDQITDGLTRQTAIDRWHQHADVAAVIALPSGNIVYPKPSDMAPAGRPGPNEADVLAAKHAHTLHTTPTQEDTVDTTATPLDAIITAIAYQIGPDAATQAIIDAAVAGPDAIEVLPPAGQQKVEVITRVTPADNAVNATARQDILSLLPAEEQATIADYRAQGLCQAPKRQKVAVKGTDFTATYVERAKPAGKWVYGLYVLPTGDSVVMLNGTWYINGEKADGVRNLGGAIQRNATRLAA